MKKKIILVLISVFLFLGIIGSVFSVNQVDVTGNRTYSKEEIEDLVFPTYFSRNTAVCVIKGLIKKKASIPFVQDYKVSLLSPTHAEIIVYEKSMIGYISYMSSNMYFDKDGIIVESANQKLEGIPEVTGLNFGRIVLYEKLSVEDERIFAILLNLTQTLSTFNIPADRIRYDRNMNAVITVGDISVDLGGPDEINGKVSELAGMLPELDGLAGTLDLSDYDPTDQNRMYSFRLR